MPWSELLRRRRWHKYESDAEAHWAGVWEDHWRGKTYQSLLADARRSRVLPFLTSALPARGIVLESGCGHGQWLECLARDGLRFVGMDRFDAAMRRGRAANPALTFLVGDIFRLPLADGRVAAILSFGVIEHFEAGFDAPLAEMRRVLADDGVVVVSVPYYSLLRRLLEPVRLLREALRESQALRRAAGRVPLPPKRFYQFAYTAPEFRRGLARCGFRSERVIYYDTEFGLTRDYAAMRALRRRFPRCFRALEAGLRAVSPTLTAHMQMHLARKSPPR